MSQKKILFLGGAYAQIPIISEAKRRGWYIITCDYLPENPGHRLADEYHNISTTDFKGVLKLAKKVKPDFVVAYASDPAAPVAAYVSEKLKLPGNTYQSIQLLAEKDLFRVFLTKNGFNAPKAISIKQDEEVSEKMDSLQLPVIVKPTDSSGSKGVTKVTSLDQLHVATEYAFPFSRNKRIIIEEFIETNGEQLHGDGFVLDGELIFSYLGDHHYDTRVNPFVPYSTTWPSLKNEDTIASVEEVLKRAVRLSGYKNGPINIEARVADDGKIYIMEIGPRSGGNFVPQIINYATGFDMVKAALDVQCGNTISNIPKKKGIAAYYVIHSEYNGVLKQLSFDDRIIAYTKEFHQYIQPGERVKSFQGSNAAIGVLLLVFDKYEEMNYYISNMDSLINLKIEQV